MPVYAWKIFLENAIEMVSIIPSNRASEAQTFRNHHHLASSHRTQWKLLLFISERVSCIHVSRTPFSVEPIHRIVNHKSESWTDGNALSRRIQMCFCVKCTRVSGNFSLMLSISSFLLHLIMSKSSSTLHLYFINLIGLFTNIITSDHFGLSLLFPKIFCHPFLFIFFPLNLSFFTLFTFNFRHGELFTQTVARNHIHYGNFSLKTR